MNTPQPLIPESFPLSGVRLIEASAGTGKTYTITSLYVRLVLGHKCEPRSPENILVVTFTRAATEELRDRIRKRLKQAHLALSEDSSLDPLIHSIKSDLDDLDLAKQRLSDAQQLMDISAIYTIHGFCQRMLSQYAFSAGMGFENRLTLDEGQLVQQAVRDVWRQEIYPMSAPYINWVLERWSSPDQLEGEVRSLLHQNVEYETGQAHDDIEKQFQIFTEQHQQLKNAWLEDGANLIEAIRTHPKANGSFVRFLEMRIAAINRVLDSGAGSHKEDIAKLAFFSSGKIAGSVKKGAESVKHRFFELVDEWLKQIEYFKQAQSIWQNQRLVAFIYQTQTQLEKIKQQQQVLAPDDLLTNLKRAISLEESGAELIQQIRQQFPIAMVDEFQDTDSQQYAIFDRVYRKENSEQDLALFMIGDPKQAIYKFRGADIFTYIQAKYRVDGSYSLGTNYRSTPEMVQAVNSIFSSHAHPFVFDEDIPFSQVAYTDKSKPLYIQNEQQSAFTWQWLTVEEKENKASLNQRFAAGAAEEIARLLLQGARGEATIGEKNVEAKDIAVLVRSGHQASIMKQALNERGIACVYVGRDSIFSTEEAQSIFHLLQATQDLNERAYRNVLALPLWQISLEQLKRFNEDEKQWDEELELLHQCHQIWQRKGVMAMLMHWLHVRQLPAVWLSLANGERYLTNILHLGELLQQISTEVQGMQGLVTWFGQVLEKNSGDQDQQQLRLESDANLVQIITLHKSKGLEYPIVFMPFLWDGKDTQDRIFYDSEKKSVICDLTGEHGNRIQTEALAEELRLLYVGLTRAVSKCYVGLFQHILADATVNRPLMKSAIGYVLSAFSNKDTDENQNVSQLSSQLDALSVVQGVFDIQSVSDTCTQVDLKSNLSQLATRQFNGRIYTDWRLSSFTGLIHKSHSQFKSQQIGHGEAFNLNPKFELAEGWNSETVWEPLGLNRFTFPKGAQAGNFLHNLLEEVDFTCYKNAETAALIENLLVKYGFDEHWLPIVEEWLNEILVAQLVSIDSVTDKNRNTQSSKQSQSALALSLIGQKQKLVEMEFTFPVRLLKAVDINRLVDEHPCLNVPFEKLAFNDLKGMLKGFIDLIFEWQGQYFVLDYKSNFLGDKIEDYHSEVLQYAMAKNRYDIQLVLYTLALHRMLKLRLPHYDYDKHIGGGYYLFLRGMENPLTGNNEQSAANRREYYGQYFHKPARQLIESLDAIIAAENQSGFNSSSVSTSEGV